MKLYFSDWRAEKKLKLISRAARSLWFDIMGLMFDEGTGRLEVYSEMFDVDLATVVKVPRPMTIAELASILGDNPRTTKKLLSEIEGAGVSSRDDRGFLYCRRIVRDFEKAERDILNGRTGGNPALLTKEKPPTRVNPKVNTQKPEAIYHIEEDKSSSTQDARDYERFMTAHPNPSGSPQGNQRWDDLIKSGVPPETLVASARAYAEKTKNWTDGKIQQSDNFLHPERGLWKENQPKAPPSKSGRREVLEFWANEVKLEHNIPVTAINHCMASEMLNAGLVTKEDLSNVRVVF
jgi:hypothetical protein